MICGDFNARCGCADETRGKMTQREILDSQVNNQGNFLLELMSDMGVCMVNGRMGQNDFIQISKRGSSVVDHCIVPLEELELVQNFWVVTMTEGMKEMRLRGEAARTLTPDQSFLMWNYVADGYFDVGENESYDDHGEKLSNQSKVYQVPDGYLNDKLNEVETLRERLRHCFDNILALNAIYEDILQLGLMTSSLVEVDRVEKQKGQPWYSRRLRGLKKEFN